MTGRLLVTGGVLAAAVALAGGCQKSLSEAPFYTDFNEGLAAAKAESKPLLVEFRTDW